MASGPRTRFNKNIRKSQELGYSRGEGMLSRLFHILGHFGEQLDAISSPPWTVRSVRSVNCVPLGMHERTPLNRFDFVLI